MITSYIQKISSHKWFWPLLTIALGIILSIPLFGPYYLHPNGHMFAFGGDALTLYYNVVYHTCYGQGDHLSAMNYPNGELIFLTDAQGSLSILLNFIHHHIVPIGDRVVGLIHCLMLLSYITSIYLLYNIYISLGIVRWRACIYAALTAVMAPQVIRMIGHHGLSYSFLIPLSFLWLLRKFRVQKFEKRDIFFVLVQTFFTFNNPYVGFGNTIFLTLSTMVYLWYNKKNFSFNLSAIALTLFPVAFLFIYLKLNDPYADRLKQQWGFFDLKSSVEGFLAPPDSLMDRVLRAVFNKGFGVGFEGIANIGLPITIILISFLVLHFFKPKLIESFRIQPVLKYMLIATSIVFLYTSAIIFLPYTKNFVENSLGFMLMFKAVARLSWPMWYVLIAIALTLSEQLLSKMSLSGFLYTVILIPSLWVVDYAVFRKPIFNDTRHPNFFSKSENNNVLDLLKNNHINANEYQAILVLPKLMYWTDHFASEHNFFNQFYSMRISKATGLPLISAMLSRMSIGQTAEKIEFIAHPLIEKSLKFPNQKKILVVLGKGNANLQEGEKYILSQSRLLVDDKDFALYEYELSKINNYPLLVSLKNNTYVGDTLSSKMYLYENFDEQKTYPGYHSAGSMPSPAGETKIAQYTIEEPQDSVYEFAAWTKVGLEKYGLGNWKVVIADSTGKVLFEQFPVNATSNDVHDDWVRASTLVRSCKKCSYQFIFCNTNDSYVDELMFRPIKYNLWFPNLQSYNGYKINMNK